MFNFNNDVSKILSVQYSQYLLRYICVEVSINLDLMFQYVPVRFSNANMSVYNIGGKLLSSEEKFYYLLFLRWVYPWQQCQISLSYHANTTVSASLDCGVSNFNHSLVSAVFGLRSFHGRGGGRWRVDHGRHSGVVFVRYQLTHLSKNSLVGTRRYHNLQIA